MRQFGGVIEANVAAVEMTRTRAFLHPILLLVVFVSSFVLSPLVVLPRHRFRVGLQNASAQTVCRRLYTPHPSGECSCSCIWDLAMRDSLSCYHVPLPVCVVWRTGLCAEAMLTRKTTRTLRRSSIAF